MQAIGRPTISQKPVRLKRDESLECIERLPKTMRWEEGGTNNSDLLQAFVLPQALAKVRLLPKCDVGGMSACKRFDVAEEFASGWYSQSFIHKNSRVERTIHTTNGKLIVDLIAKVNGKGGQAASARQVCVHEFSRVMRTVDASNGKLSVDCTAKVDGEDGKVAGALKVCVHEISV